MAGAPAVVDQDEAAMRAYFKRVQPPKCPAFTGGIGWIDLAGASRVSSSADPSVPGVNVADRAYFKAVVGTQKPFISEGLTTRRTGEHAIVMAVPTRDAAGKLSGVLAGVLLVSPTPARSNGDRSRVRRAGRVRPHRAVGARRLRQAAQHGVAGARCARIADGGVIGSTDGFDGSSDHVVGYATSKVPALDRGDRPAPVHACCLRRAAASGWRWR